MDQKDGFESALGRFSDAYTGRHEEYDYIVKLPGRHLFRQSRVLTKGKESVAWLISPARILFGSLCLSTSQKPSHSSYTRNKAHLPPMYVQTQLYRCIIIILSQLCQPVELKLGCPIDKAHSCCWYFIEPIPPVTRKLVCQKEPNLEERSCDGEEFRRCCNMDEVCLIFQPLLLSKSS